MMKVSPPCIALGLALTATLAPLRAQSLSAATPVATHGSWSVMRLADNNCIGVLKGDESVRITPVNLKVPIRGLIQTITLRFGDRPAWPTRKPTDTETELNAVLLSNAEFTEALQSSRLRVQVQTFARGIAKDDIELNGAQAAVEVLKSSCPVAGTTPVAAAVPAVPPPPAPAPATAPVAIGAAPIDAAPPAAVVAAPSAVSAAAMAGSAAASSARLIPADVSQCPPLVVERMRSIGLREAQILMICR